jgi:hypothetical protein
MRFFLTVLIISITSISVAQVKAPESSVSGYLKSCFDHRFTDNVVGTLDGNDPLESPEEGNVFICYGSVAKAWFDSIDEKAIEEYDARYGHLLGKHNGNGYCIHVIEGTRDLPPRYECAVYGLLQR